MSRLLFLLYSSASCTLLSPLPLNPKDLTTLIPCTYSSTAEISAVWDFCAWGATALDFFSMEETIRKYTKIPATTTSPTRHSKIRIIMVKTTVPIRPPMISTNTIGTSISIFPSTVVQTPVTSPRLFSLKNPIGTLFKRLPILIRSFAAIKYPAWVCWFLEKAVVTALPIMLTAIKASAVHAAPFSVSPCVSATITK